MYGTTGTVQELVRRVRGGDRDALGELLERHRGYLRLMALRFLDERFAGRLDASDVIQQTCLSAFRNFDRFTGDRPEEFIAWLREIHERKLTDAFREHVVAQKRSSTREATADASQVGATASTTSPCQRLMADERAVELARNISELPTEQAEAVRLRFLEGLAMNEIAQRMQRTPDSIIGLIRRGIVALRDKLQFGGDPRS